MTIVFYSICLFGIATGCGRRLGMITGDIAEFQIETSSNDQDMQYLRPLNGFGLWCAPREDRNKWIMVITIQKIKYTPRAYERGVHSVHRSGARRAKKGPVNL
jgi:hypothetical protein